MHKQVLKVTETIIKRSAKSRRYYLANVDSMQVSKPRRKALSCGNFAHGFAACTLQDKSVMRGTDVPNIAIVSAYNDMLSAHQPYENYPSIIKKAIRNAGGVSQFAGGVPAMCDGITQGQPGMDLSLMSRDVVAMASAVALSHDMFDGGLMLGICDKIVPGLLISALRFGHLPFIFIPAGPMPSGISNIEKTKMRQAYAEGRLSHEALLEVEAQSYHSPGTCTFYGTANSNQMLVEILGLQLPGSSFINPGTALRDALTIAAAEQIVSLSQDNAKKLAIGKLISEKSIVNAIVGLLATGGSTNHTMHLVAIARCAGINITWDDFSDLSKVTPLIARIYPNGPDDINAFQRAGGMSYLMGTLLEAGLLHPSVDTVLGHGLERYTKSPTLIDNKLSFHEGPKESLNPSVLSTTESPFDAQGGLTLLSGNLGRAIMKVSALQENQRHIEAPAMVFNDQNSLEHAFKLGALNRDCILVLRFQGPKACGMPELHGLTPLLGALQDRGYRVALLTDGRMSGASGKVPTAIHVTPEAVDGGVIAKIQDGDMIMLNAHSGIMQLMLSDQALQERPLAECDLSGRYEHYGRDMFRNMRLSLGSAETGACSLFETEEGILDEN